MAKAFDVFGYVESNLSKTHLNTSGQILAECPWCSKYGSFYIDSTTGHYICHKCGEKGRHLVGLVAHTEGISWSEAKAFILKKSIQFQRKETACSLLDKIRALRPVDSGVKRDSILVDVPLPGEFLPIYDHGKWSYPVYLKQRHISRRTAKTFGMGYCDAGRYWGRIVIPINCPHGCSFTARDTTETSKLKYLNPKGANHGRLLLGWDVVNMKQDLTLVEGPLDAARLWQHGIQSLALSGKTLHPSQFEMLVKCSSRIAITVMLDPDAQVDAYNIASQLTCHFERVYIASLPDGTDPGSSAREQALDVYHSSKRYDGNRNEMLAAKLAAAKNKMSIIFD